MLVVYATQMFILAKGMLGVKFPYTTGHEPAGEIVALGEGVTTKKSWR